MRCSIERRAFLQLAGGIGLSAAAAGCTRTNASRSSSASGSSAVAASSRPAAAVTTGAPVSDDLTALRRALGDRLVLPSDSDYAAAAQLFDPRFDVVHPAAIARCTGPADVQRCLEFARATGTPFAARSGGHSYGGYSTTSGLVINVAAMNGIARGNYPGTARVGAGARLADVYGTLAADGVCIPAGSCPTVGITGLTLGGGIGVVARKYGLTCDVLTAVEVVTADGRTVRCDERTEPDLFWAHRGGGGGNFGVVTALEFRTQPTPALTHFLVRWDWTHALDVVAAWQSWLATTPVELWSSLHIDGARSASGTPQVYATGVYVGDPTGLRPWLDALEHARGAAMTTRFVAEADYLRTMMIEGGCANLSLAECRPQREGGRLGRESGAARSDFIAGPLTASGIDVVLSAIESRRTRNLPGGSVLFDAYGGAINQVGPSDTAFVHRDKLACLQYVSGWPTPATEATVAANRAWLDALYVAMRPHVSGYAYQNYIDPGLADWQHAYYGANLGRLTRVKAAYDPAGLFRFPQGIPTRSIPTTGAPATSVQPASVQPAGGPSAGSTR